MNNYYNTKNFLNTPLKIGSSTIEKRAVLAPMAGINHIAFRKILSQFKGYGLLFTGMVNARAVPTENRYKSNVFRWDDDELSSLGVQIFGNEPKAMSEAAKRIEDEGFFCIDINFGCCVKAICHKEYGAALLKEPDKAASIIEEVRKAVSFPIFVKFRTGWEDNVENAVKTAKKFENAGADALTFHPRVAPDRRSRPPKHEYTKIIKENVKIPVFANGNIFTIDDAEKIIQTTNCDGISIGRIAVAKPWIFASWTLDQNFGYDIYKFTLQKALKEFTDYFGNEYGFKLFKKFYLYFCANFKFGHQFSGLFAGKNTSHEEALEKIELLFKNSPEIVKRPNLNLFTH